MKGIQEAGRQHKCVNPCCVIKMDGGKLVSTSSGHAISITI